MEQPTEQPPTEQQPAEQQPAQQPQGIAYMTVGQSSHAYPVGNAMLQQLALQTATQMEAIRVQTATQIQAIQAASENRSRLTAAMIQSENMQTQQRISEMQLASARYATESAERSRLDRMAQRNRHTQDYIDYLRGVDTTRLYWQPGPSRRWP